MSDYTKEMASTIEGVQIDGSSIPDGFDIPGDEYKIKTNVPDYIPVKYGDKVGLTPNKKSPNFKTLNHASKGYVVFWIPDVDIKGVSPESLTKATWLEYAQSIVHRLLLDNPSEIITWLSNSNEFKSRYFSASDLLDNIVCGFTREYGYDFKRFHNL